MVYAAVSCDKKQEAATVAVTGVTLTPGSATMHKGDNITLVAVVLPENATNRNVRWRSSSDAVSVFDGRVLAVSEGTAVVTAVTEDGAFEAKCNITVVSQTGTRIVVEPSLLSLSIGQQSALKAIIEPESSAMLGVVWSSDDDTVATVNADGMVTAVKAGTVAVKATSKADSSVSASCLVTVSGSKDFQDGENESHHDSMEEDNYEKDF